MLEDIRPDSMYDSVLHRTAFFGDSLLCVLTTLGATQATTSTWLRRPFPAQTIISVSWAASPPCSMREVGYWEG